MRIRINGKFWELVFVKEPIIQGEPCLGFCEAPTKKGKKIVIKEDLKGEKLLEILIHEQLHASLWVAEEEWVSETGVDLARNIVRLMKELPDKFDIYGE